MRSVARRLKAEHGLGLIVVDYLQLMQTSKNHDSMVNQVTEISRSLKGLARELDVPVLALSQLSRAVEQRGANLVFLTFVTLDLSSKMPILLCSFTVMTRSMRIQTVQILQKSSSKNTVTVQQAQYLYTSTVQQHHSLILIRIMM